MTGATQLTIDGREVAHPVARRGAESPAQAEILRHARLHGLVTTLEAGLILHAHRDGGRGCHPEGIPSDRRRLGRACCPWTSVDGNRACYRLAARGLLERRYVGEWYPVTEE